VTPRQKQALDFIKAEIARCGVAPTFDEIKQELGLASKSSIHRLLTGLEEAGHIERRFGRNRAIAIPGGTTSCGLPHVHVTPSALLVAKEGAAATGKPLHDFVSACIHHFEVRR
jgi:SOS-response transcriptional repressor LexA